MRKLTTVTLRITRPSKPDPVGSPRAAEALLARESSGDFTIVLTFSLLGLSLSLLAIGTAGFIDPEYMANLLMLF